MVGFDGQLVLSTGEGGQEVPCPGSLASVCVVGGWGGAEKPITCSLVTMAQDWMMAETHPFHLPEAPECNYIHPLIIFLLT
jgi:hypothetical protein